MFITQRVFDPELVGCAVYIGGANVKGERFNRTYLVKEAKGQTLSIISCSGNFDYVNIKDFNGNLKMEILERPQAIPGRAQKQPEQLELVQVIQEVLREPGRKRATAKGRVIRTQTQVETEMQAVQLFLSKAYGQPIRLEQIIRVMRAQGYNWNNKNASGFIRETIKKGGKIKKVGHGIYAFAAEVQA